MLDGIYQGAAALVSVASGVLADRWRRHKEVAALGYGLSAACRLLILVAGNAWGIIAAIITLDRIGKGIRTAPRDSLISQRSPEPELATAFGVHRAMDAAGAMLGPVLAFALLALMPRRFDVLFVASFGVAIIGLGSITLFVPAVVTGERQISRTPDSPRKALQLLGDSRFRALVFTGVVLGLATISESFIFLILQRRFDVGISAFPLLYVGTSLFTSAFAIPCGRLADRLGRTRVLLGGYGVLAMVYVILLLSAAGGLLVIAAVVFLLGIFYAATDGVLTAMAAAALPMEHSGSGLAVLATATNLARLAASVTFGLLWSHAGIGQATVCYLLALAVAILGAYFVLNRPKQHVI
jgi:MFS family permease